MVEILPGAAAAAADMLIKDHMEKAAPVGVHRSSGCPLFEFVLHHNYGSAGNLGADRPALIRAVSVVLTAFCTVLFILSFSRKGAGTLRLGLGLLLGGAFSNTYDRLKKGYVTDYIRFSKGPAFLRRLIWNISDFAIIIGTLIVVINS